jgi:hypothetical protein
LNWVPEWRISSGFGETSRHLLLNVVVWAQAILPSHFHPVQKHYCWSRFKFAEAMTSGP